MLRFILLLLLVGLALAIRYLPWQVLVGGALMVVALFYLLRGRVFLWLFSMPFRAKGAVLRGATATVHRIAPIEVANLRAVRAPDDEDPDDDYDPGPREFYELEATITPGPTPGPFLFWEVSEVRLVEPGYRALQDNSDDACLMVESKVISEVIEAPTAAAMEDGSSDEDDEDDEDDKVLGPRRVWFLIGVRPGLRRLVFAYYFETFGEVNLPDRAAPRISG
ncbi:MAG: hypothetical protein U0736_09760 [Gemmataceae bacterium]